MFYMFSSMYIASQRCMPLCKVSVKFQTRAEESGALCGFTLESCTEKKGKRKKKLDLQVLAAYKVPESPFFFRISAASACHSYFQVVRSEWGD